MRNVLNGLCINGEGGIVPQLWENDIPGDFLTFSKKSFASVQLFYFHNFLVNKNRNLIFEPS